MPTDDDDTDEPIPKEKGFIRRTFELPCMRDTAIYTISGILFGWIGAFFFTSDGVRAMRISTRYIMPGIAFPYWIFCRYQFYLRDSKGKELQAAVPPKYEKYVEESTTDDNSKQ